MSIAGSTRAPAMGDAAIRAFHRVDAARRLMHDVHRAPEGLGRLYVAKRVHEAAKEGAIDLDAILAGVLDAVDDPRVQEGARKEHAFFRDAGD